MAMRLYHRGLIKAGVLLEIQHLAGSVCSVWYCIKMIQILQRGDITSPLVLGFADHILFCRGVTCLSRFRGNALTAERHRSGVIISGVMNNAPTTTWHRFVTRRGTVAVHASVCNNSLGRGNPAHTDKPLTELSCWFNFVPSITEFSGSLPHCGIGTLDQPRLAGLINLTT